MTDIFPYLVATALLFLLAFFMGCLIGYLSRRMVWGPPTKTEAIPETATEQPVVENTVIKQEGKEVSASTAPQKAAVKPKAKTAAAKPAKVSKPAAKTPAKAAAKPKPKRVAKPATPKAPATKTPVAAENPADAGKPVGLAKPNGAADDLKKIKGIGPKIETTLNGLGIYHYAQVRDWTRENIDWVDTSLSFKGRIDRENWVEQAKDLAKKPGK